MDFLHESIKRKVNISISGTPQNNYDNLKLKSIETWKNFLKVVDLHNREFLFTITIYNFMSIMFLLYYKS